MDQSHIKAPIVQNSNLEEWGDGYKRSLYKEQPVEAEEHTHIYSEPVYYFIFTFQYFVT